MCFLDRFSRRAHKHLKMLLERHYVYYDPRNVYIEFCESQLGMTLVEDVRQLRSRVMLSYHQCYPDDHGPDAALFYSQTRVDAFEKNRPAGPQRYPARPARVPQPRVVELAAEDVAQTQAAKPRRRAAWRW